MGLPDLGAPAQGLHEVENGAEELVQIREALHQERLSSQGLVPILASYHPLGQEIDEGVGLSVDVIAVENHLGVVEYLSQTPNQRFGIAGQCFIGPEAVQVHPVGLERRIVSHVLERQRQ
jgi:hypothetical protein